MSATMESAVDNQEAHKRFYIIAIGCGVCLLMSLLIFPNRLGEDLDHSNVSKLKGLAKSMQGIDANC
jgi:hypothetical protein